MVTFPSITLSYIFSRRDMSPRMVANGDLLNKSGSCGGQRGTAAPLIASMESIELSLSKDMEKAQLGFLGLGLIWQ